MPVDIMEEVLSSRARLRIMDAVSVRPRTLVELSDAAGISVQGVLRHLKRLVEIGLVEELPLSRVSPRVRRVYGAASARVRDYSSGGFTVVRSTEALPGKRGTKVRDLEGAAGDLLIMRRRIGEHARKLGRMIDEAADGQDELASAIRSLAMSPFEKLVLEVALTEDTLDDGASALSKYYGIEGRMSIESVLAKVKRIV
ncbi:MAG: winged helix-turn-helix transcriptional regulator [Nitrososphaerota archaeon]|nr:winged helix-turn-helix transcriptional regulator [Nitrososphaerota archaeon]